MLRKTVISLTIVVISAVCVGETWRLGSGQQWQRATDSNESAFAVAVSAAKQFVSTGQPNRAKRAYDALKRDFPEIVGSDFDAYVKAEMLYAKRKFAQAAQEYEKFIEDYPESWLRQSALERQYQIGSAFLNGQKRTVLLIFKLHAYEEGTEIMNKIADTAGDAPIAKKAIRTLALANEKRGAYDEAYLAWADAANRWPTGDIGQEALLGMARSLEKDYKGPKYDSKVLESARSYYNEYIERYPQSAAELGLKDKVSRIEQDLAMKELEIAKYYERTENYKAADMYCEKITEEFADTPAAQNAQAKLPTVKKQFVESQIPKKRKFNWKELFL